MSGRCMKSVIDVQMQTKPLFVKAACNTGFLLSSIEFTEILDTTHKNLTNLFKIKNPLDSSLTLYSRVSDYTVNTADKGVFSALLKELTHLSDAEIRLLESESVFKKSPALYSAKTQSKKTAISWTD